MNFFPVTHSNLSGIHLALFLKKHYSFKADITCRLIRSGINDTYVITSDHQKFVFRVYSLNWRSEKEILEEICLLNLLKQNAVSISYPVADLHNNYIQTLNAPEGDRYGVLFSYAEGEKLHSFSETIHFEIGKIMAGLHLVTNHFNLERVTYTPQILLSDSLDQIRKFLPADCEEMKFMLSAQAYLMEQLAKMETGNMRTGVVHLDIWFENLNITTDGKITIFDFDFCGNGWLALDIAFYMLQVYATERDEEQCKSKLESFMNGYGSITKITEEEKRMLPAFGICLYFFYLGIQCQRFDNWSNSFLSESYLKRYINGLVKRYYDIHHLGNH